MIFSWRSALASDRVWIIREDRVRALEGRIMAKQFLRLSLWSAVLFLFAQAPLWAQDKRSELLEETKRKLDLTAQKLQAEVSDNLAEAEKLAKTNPGKAAQLLRRTLVSVSDDVSMTANKRESLLKSLREQIQK